MANTWTHGKSIQSSHGSKLEVWCLKTVLFWNCSQKLSSKNAVKAVVISGAIQSPVVLTSLWVSPVVSLVSTNLFESLVVFTGILSLW